MSVLTFVAVGVGLLVGFLFMPKAPKAKGANMSPASLDSFSVSNTEEGATVPLVFGTVRINSNILFYGNLRTEPVYEKVKGGKGGGKSKKVLVGYQYWLDIWHGIARGPLEILEVLADDKPLNLNDFAYGFNDGAGNYYPDRVGEFATKLPGMAHMFFVQYDLGQNTTHVPTLHFIIRDKNTVPFSYGRLDNGLNPAAIIYLLLTEAGANVSQFDIAGFQLAARRYAAKGYGLNISFSQKQKTRDAIETVLNYAGGYYVETQTDAGVVFNIKVPDVSDPVMAVLSDDDYASFKMERTSQDKVPNVLTAKFMDKNMGYTQRAIICKNSAAVAQCGRIDKSIDLTAYIDHASAQTRLAELLRNLSYPGGRFAFELGVEHSRLALGDLVEISHGEWGITGAKARITYKEMPGPEGATYSFQAELDPLFIQDASFVLPDYAPQWVQPDYTPEDLTKVKLWEMPRTPHNLDKPALLILAARQIGVETGFGVLWSADGTDYEAAGECAIYCQYGNLSGAYSAATYDIDDDIGLIYTPWREDPEFDAVSRTNLFNFRRLALVDDELMAFQNVELLPGDKIKLTGIIRGVYGTVKANHANNAAIWILPVQADLFFEDLPQTGRIKLLPYFGNDILDDGASTAYSYSLTNKAAIPYAVGRIVAVRTGGTVNITWWPCDVEPFGAGVKSESYTDQDPFLFNGDFMYRIGTSGAYTSINGTTLQISRTSSFTFNVQARQNGYLSAVKSLPVGAADGTYII